MSRLPLRRPQTSAVAALALAVILVVGVAGSKAGAQERLQEQPQLHLKSHADLVVLQVAVIDRRGRFVPGLDSSSFRVYEDGKPQELRFFDRADAPVTAGLVIDSSGSMRGKRDTVVAAGLAFARASNPDDDIFLVLFNERARLGLPHTLPFSSSLALLRASLMQLVADGRTAMFDALDLALSHADKGRYDRKVLIVLGDGGDNSSGRTFEDVLTRARGANTVIHTVALIDPHDTDANPGLLKRLARETGGSAHQPEALEQIVSLFEGIAQEIRSAYTIGYVPSNSARDGSYRVVRVIVSAPGRSRLEVRTREGYLAPGGTP